MTCRNCPTASRLQSFSSGSWRPTRRRSGSFICLHTNTESSAEITREEFFHHGLRAATGYDVTMAGSAVQVADRFEEVFEATGSRGGFMLSISQAAPRAVMMNIVDFLVDELKRRGRYRDAYKGRTLRENLAC